MAKTETTDSPRGNDAIQNSTTSVPMVDLEEAINVVTNIRDKALETAAMAAVAEGLGYANATSTPFYRRISAARLFGLLAGRTSLTQDAVDYIRPHDEETKSRVLMSAVKKIPVYATLIERYAGKKINVSLVANAIAKDCNLTDSCAAVCANAFEASIKFAGMLSADGTLQTSRPASVPLNGDRPPPAVDQRINPPADAPAAGEQTHTIFLDKNKSRSLKFTGPLDITKAEFARICKWLEFTMLIAEDVKESQ